MVKKKSLEIAWDRKALNDLKRELKFLSKKSTNAPTIVKDSILSRLNSVKANAFICEADKLKDDSDKLFRAFVVYSYRVTYQIKSEKSEIRVIRIRHTSREPLGY
jgi:plasmid stabilization system protein ParE